MLNVEETVISNYQNNMDFFKKNHTELFNKITALEVLLENGEYPQKYELEYKDGYFDVIELVSKVYLYNQNSEIFSDELTNNISFRKNDQVFESFYSYKFTQAALDKFKNASVLTSHVTTSPIIHYHDTHTSESMNMEKIYKFIFLGLGLALHLPKIINKIGNSAILIVEDNIELFRLSMFTCNYKDALKDCVAFFSVAQNTREFSETYNQFHNRAFTHNLYLKFSLFSTQYEKKISEIQSFLLSRAEVGYPHEHLLTKNIKVLKQLKNDYGFLDFSKKPDELFFADKPILVIAAGPSLHLNIEWLKKNSEDFILIAAFAALKTLQKINISPDIVVQIDENIKTTEAQMDTFDSFDFLKDTIFIFSASVPHILFDTFTSNKIYLLEDRTHYKLNNAYLSSPSVGELTYAISLIFNAREIYLLGLDLALSDDGLSHAKDHLFSKELDILTADKTQKSASHSGTILQRKGNFRNIVNTTPLLAASIQPLNRFTRSYKSDNQIVYNLNDGAYFDNTRPLLAKDYDKHKLIDKSNIQRELSTLFDKYSVSQITENELAQLKVKQTQIEDYYKYIEIFERSATSNKAMFIQKYHELIKSIITSTSTELREIMVVYVHLTTPYVTDLFNTQELKNHKKHTKQIKKIIIIQIKKIIKFYEEELSKTIEELQHTI